jgi:RNA polymerase sigma factor (sigma-70 family)
MWMMTRSPPTGSAADAVLVDLARRGDREAFTQLIRRRYGVAQGVCLRALGEQGTAQDAVQDATRTAWLSIDRLLHPDRFGPWLCGIALNNARQILRAKLTQSRVLSSIGGETQVSFVEDAVIADELRSRVRRAVDELPTGQREAVRLYYLSGLTQREAAGELGVSVNAVKARLHEARQHLKSFA